MTPEPASPIIAPPVIDLDALLGFREITERISGFLHKRLKDHLVALSPLLSVSRVLGKHAGGRESAARADEALAELSTRYHQVSAALPYSLPDIDEETLGALGSSIQLHPYEYIHEAQTAKGPRNISMTSPVRWVVTYGTEYTLSQIRGHLTGDAERRPLPVRQFVVSALAFQAVLARSSAASHLLQDLRYTISVESLPGIPHLPLAVLGIDIASFRPPDDMLLTATRLSGVSSFIELIHHDAIAAMVDPLRKQIESLASPA